MGDELEARVRFLEVAHAVDDARLNELESWRRKDEPTTAKLNRAADFSEELRLTREQWEARAWSIWAKIAAAVSGAVVITAGVLEILTRVGVLHG